MQTDFQLRNRRRRAFTLVELLVVIAIITILVALLLPAVQSAREAGRKSYCRNNLRQIALALREYVDFNEQFPPGCIVEGSYTATNCPSGSSNSIRINPWTDAISGEHGTSWMLQITPFIEQQNIFDNWDFTTNVAGNEAAARVDIKSFFCPTRRSRTRAEDQPIMFQEWSRGGTDYGGCMGYVNGWLNNVESNGGHRFLACETLYDFSDGGVKRGIFLPNSTTSLALIRDGLSHTIMAGEMQRLQIPEGSNVTDEVLSLGSNDGWATGGVATLFQTASAQFGGDVGNDGGFNNGFFESAGSEHSGGANFAMADGSTHYLSENFDSEVYAYLGAIKDGEMAQLPGR